MNSALNQRQEAILKILEKQGGMPVSQIQQALETEFKGLPKITVNRDLAALIEKEWVIAKGKSRAIRYFLSPHALLTTPLDPGAYFEKEVDEREGRTSFNFEIFGSLKNIFTAQEENHLKTLHAGFQKNKKAFPQALYEKEFERLTIEFSWKSSRIEGNTYTLLETERLIKDHEKAAGHKAEEVAMILNHKKALDTIRSHEADYKTVTVRKIENIHRLLVADLNIAHGIRKGPVAIVGTKYRPLDNQFQLHENLEKACALVNGEKNLFAKAFLMILLIAYLQPFEDGNKRTSRLTGNALLLAHKMCPLSYRSVDEIEYKKAVILFYEQNNLSYFKQLFFEQVEFAVKNYFV